MVHVLGELGEEKLFVLAPGELLDLEHVLVVRQTTLFLVLNKGWLDVGICDIGVNFGINGMASIDAVTRCLIVQKS